jgi:hypothetical protein
VAAAAACSKKGSRERRRPRWRHNLDRGYIQAYSGHADTPPQAVRSMQAPRQPRPPMYLFQRRYTVNQEQTEAVQGAEVKLSFYRLRRRAQSETSSRSRFQSSHDQQKWFRTERSGKSAFHSLSGTGYFLRLPAPKSGSSSVTRMWAWRHRRWEGQTRHPIWETHQCGARGRLRGGGSRNSGVACTRLAGS